MTPGDWTPAHSEMAAREGWNIFEAIGHDDGDYQIQRHDEAGILDSDQEAWQLVWAKSRAGSALHLHAVAVISALNLPEYNRMKAASE